ncbi:type II toxin-antitoxin system MqsA family antitoxin [Cyclobacterium plantarum]|uniref:Type II toxin-antitoxin system MqsA family antitoxin n=1 Tax=Cyclobacterium plantarum TaxID=2716263 RepID=A0ABX0H7R8_9BACT|nr:type II toxin-antitoxin system MqsA family antitoxin [Cyclobacterium plantarum]NHE56948.1 type II toxin-antitoxin system MqsA family antitoxin [Cyclobacterium plantarum]
MECSLCKNGTTEKGYVTVTLEKGETIVLIKSVPAEVCTNCGHYYLSEKTTQLVLDKGKEAYSKGTELEVVKLQVA